MRSAAAFVSVVVGATSLLTPDEAFGYATATPLTPPCHEEMTLEALAQARAELDDDGFIEPTRNERALIEDAPFAVSEDLADLGAVTLALGNRHVDFGSFEVDDLDRLAPIHGSPTKQHEHCLRSPDQDGPDGSRAALEACRDYIRERIEKALTGLDGEGRVDPDERTELEIALDLRGTVSAELPTFYVEMGHALHAVQDGFSHAFRTPDHLRVVTVLNFVDSVRDEPITDADGPLHVNPLDECRGLDEYRSERIDVATRASREFLVAALDTSLSPEEKRAEVERLLDRYFTHTDDCDGSVSCSGVEEEYRASSGTCSVAWQDVGAPGALGVLLVVLGFGGWRRISRRAAARRHPRAGAALVCLAVVLSSPRPASAEPLPAAESTSSASEARPFVEPTEKRGGFGVALGVAGAIENAALAGSLGLRFAVNDHFLIGIDGEYNPWIAPTSSDLRPGVASLYSTFVLRFPLAYERVNLRTTLQLGATRMLFDLYGVPEGSMGPYVGFNLLGIDYELGRHLWLVLNPAHIAIPIPQLSGVVYANPQYRISLGLEWGG